ncbi:MAG: hypothetical protein DUD27_04310 [Lachnospiraceae bacterium]|uniref:Uncharacterized protein n=1 Tax=Candidatus Weimeria bifida TaxID=2599074 RepID=A0A6N7IZS9_9FIRM|nr:hypothetical protein [Candidatus Weimeria bifida]RRF96566.1 MAG: hypothetical protein DUD27_04310 [Lachnospiraceae bacterium]
MKSIQIKNIKKFMSDALIHETFDKFTISEATVKTAVSFVIDGKINRDFFGGDPDLPEDGSDSEESVSAAKDSSAKGNASGEFYREPFIKYGKIRHILFEIIKGKRTPVFFRLVFHAPRQLTEQILAEADTGFTMRDVNSLTFTATFKDGGLTVTTGTNLAAFSLDKSVDEAWDKYMEKYMEQFD